ncbi:MAG: DUF5818 domain-containing protein [Syntrophobacterales bacterium]|nr:DUF5818 domain-containing protein [Syntrophobacterales bacterium]
MKKQALVGLVTALAVGLTFTLAQASDEAKKPASTQPTQQTQAAPEKKEAAMGVVVKGKIEAAGEKFLLKTEDKKEFNLDGKDLKNYVGKEVEVKGQLNKATQTIKVEEIKEAKPAK